MVDIGRGFFLGGAAEGRDVLASQALEERALGLREAERQDALRLQVAEAIQNTVAQAQAVIAAAPNRDAIPAETLNAFRGEIAAIADRAAKAGLGIDREAAFQQFELGLVGARTMSETAVAEAQSNLVGAATTASALQSLPPEQQELVSRVLGLTAPAASEFFQILDALEATPVGTQRHNLLLGRAQRLASAQVGETFSIQVMPDGSVTFSQGAAAPAPAGAGVAPGAAPALPARMTLTGGQLNELRTAGNEIDRGVEIIDRLLASDVEFGAVEGLRRLTETAGGVIEDLTGIPIDQTVERLSSEFAEAPELVSDMSTGEVSALEAQLIFALARALQPTGRLNVTTLEQARNSVSLRGFRSDQQVRDSLQAVRSQLQARRQDVQRQMEQGVGAPVTPPAPPSPDTLLEDLDALLEGG